MAEKLMVGLRIVDNMDPVKALAEITIPTEFGELTIVRIKVIHQNGKEPWVALPDIRFKDSSGEYRSVPIVIPGRRLKSTISETVLSKYREGLENDPPF